MFNREKLISHLHEEKEVHLAGQIMDKIEIVTKRKANQTTNFLNPYQLKIAKDIIKQIYEVNYLVDGGYQEAERSRITIFPDFLYPDHVNSSVSILKIIGNFKFQNIDHRDYLGSLMGLGIKREMLGDILVCDNYGQVVIADEIKDFLQIKLKNIHEVPVEVKEIGREDLVIPHDNTKEIQATVPSMRLDAVASVGFGDSRSKISRAVKNEKIKLNWKVEDNPAKDVEVGDMISFRGRGRVKVFKRNGLSHRGRIKLTVKRYT